MALDIGDKRIGVALSDLMQITSQPFTTITYKTSKEALAEIKNIMAEQNVVKVIAGYPLNLAGEATRQTEKTEGNIRYFEKQLRLKIERVDERFTSQDAEAHMRQLGFKPSQDKAAIDKNCRRLDAEKLFGRTYGLENDSCYRNRKHTKIKSKVSYRSSTNLASMSINPVAPPEPSSVSLAKPQPLIFGILKFCQEWQKSTKSVSPLNWSDAIFIPRTLFLISAILKLAVMRSSLCPVPVRSNRKNRFFTVAETVRKKWRAHSAWAAPLNPAPHRIPSRGSAKRD
jgi:putative Holliday junction resolvase